MDFRARSALEKLLAAGNRQEARLRERGAALTAQHLRVYRHLPSLESKEAFETEMRAASACAAVELEWDDITRSGFISRVVLVDIGRLAAFLGRPRAADVVAAAQESFRPFLLDHPVLTQVLAKWARLNRVRGLDTTEIALWIDAIRVVEFSKHSLVTRGEDMPVRLASVRLFNDSKRIEKLSVALDILVAGSLDEPPRSEREIWQELGLFREEQPVRMAGAVVVRRQRITAMLDTPYGAFPAETVSGIVGECEGLLTIENLTSFHVEARTRESNMTLLLYTAGMPSPAWRAMYRRLLATLPRAASIRHWGDVDEGGYRIAALLSRECSDLGRPLVPWRMAPEYVSAELRRPATAHTVERMAKYALECGWSEIASSIKATRFTAEQEGLH